MKLQSRVIINSMRTGAVDRTFHGSHANEPLVVADMAGKQYAITGWCHLDHDGWVEQLKRTYPDDLALYKFQIVTSGPRAVSRFVAVGVNFNRADGRPFSTPRAVERRPFYMGVVVNHA